MTMGITSPTSTTGQILKNGSAVISFDANNNATFAGNVAPTVNPTMRNRIINGAMVIDQRNAGASVTPTNGSYTLDRWIYQSSQASKISIQQNAGSVTPPVGFTNYLGATSLSAYTVGSSETFVFSQRIEGLNVADLAWGTANASAVTLSFKVYSSLTGTFGGVIGNYNATRAYPFSYTVSSANTWTTVSVTISGDTSGTWLTTNGTGIIVYFSLGTGATLSGTAGSWSSNGYYSATGATSVVGTNGATFYITGVQLEAGSVATPFEQRLYGTELALCQRYLPAFSLNDQFFGGGVAYNSTAGFIIIPFPVSTRTNPTGITTTGSFLLYTTTLISASSVTFSSAGTTSGLVLANVTGAAAGNGCVLKANTTASILFTGCEL